MIISTAVVLWTMMYFHSDGDNILGGKKYFQLSKLATAVKSYGIRNDEDHDIIDDKTLNEFIKFYSNKSLDSIEIFEREEIRYILEMMGKYNTNKLKRLLSSQSDKREQRIFKLLNENLFDEQLMILNGMLD